MRNRWLFFVILSALVLSSLGATTQQAKGSMRGYVFRDDNQNGVMDSGEEGIPGVYVTISTGEYYHTYYSGDGDPNGDVPGPGSYGPTPLPSGTWKVTVHVPDGYRATSQTEIFVYVPDGAAATGANFGLYGSGAITYSAGTGVGMGGGMLPVTGSEALFSPGQSIALLAALVGLLAVIGTPWCVAQVKRVHKRWW